MILHNIGPATNMRDLSFNKIECILIFVTDYVVHPHVCDKKLYNRNMKQNTFKLLTKISNIFCFVFKNYV